MNFDLSDEQRLLQDSLNRFVAERCDFHKRLKAMAEPEGYSPATWKALADLGVLGLRFAEEDGGFGCGPVETMVVMEALGRGLVIEPYFSTAVLAGGALRIAAGPSQKAGRIEAIVAGDHRMALAHNEPGGPRHTVDRLATAARATADGWCLEGAKTAVLHGGTADEFIVSATSRSGVSLFLVPADTAGVRVTARTGYDGNGVAEVKFDDVPLPPDALLGAEGGGPAILTALFEEANAALAAEAVGIMADILETTIDYLKTRTQFGVAIGSFQALQHRAVDMLMEVELARSMAILAALSLERPAGERRLNIAAAKARIGRAGRFVGQQAVQMHGAIGLTSEYKVGHAFKRLTAIDALFGDSDHHLEELAQADGLVPIGS